MHCRRRPGICFACRGALVRCAHSACLSANVRPQMTPRPLRYLKLAVLATTLWIAYLAPWPGPAWLTPLKPAIISAAFALFSLRLGVDSWPLIIFFSFTFFIHGVVDAYMHGLNPDNDLKGAPADTRNTMLHLWAVIFSPISLWAPLLFGAVAYGLGSRARSNQRLERP